MENQKTHGGEKLRKKLKMSIFNADEKMPRNGRTPKPEVVPVRHHYRCKDLDVRVGQHAALVNDLQPQLQQIWQEQLDRVRRQQVLFREKVYF